MTNRMARARKRQRERERGSERVTGRERNTANVIAIKKQWQVINVDRRLYKCHWFKYCHWIVCWMCLCVRCAHAFTRWLRKEVKRLVAHAKTISILEFQKKREENKKTIKSKTANKKNAMASFEKRLICINYLKQFERK